MRTMVIWVADTDSSARGLLTAWLRAGRRIRYVERLRSEPMIRRLYGDHIAEFASAIFLAVLRRPGRVQLNANVLAQIVLGDGLAVEVRVIQLILVDVLRQTLNQEHEHAPHFDHIRIEERLIADVATETGGLWIFCEK